MVGLKEKTGRIGELEDALAHVQLELERVEFSLKAKTSAFLIFCHPHDERVSLHLQLELEHLEVSWHAKTIVSSSPTRRTRNISTGGCAQRHCCNECIVVLTVVQTVPQRIKPVLAGHRDPCRMQRIVKQRLQRLSVICR